MNNDFDFSGWCTKANLRCSDGRIILKDAFKNDDGRNVPLVWNHQHNEVENVLGHAMLENRDEGVYAYCKFNDTESGKNAKLLVEHGDISSLSIFAHQLKQQGSNVLHGAIREVSLVLAGANPGAFIDSIIKHGEESDEEAIIYTGEDISLSHADDSSDDETLSHASCKTEPKKASETPKKEEKADNEKKPDSEEKDSGEETIEDVFNTLTEKQKNAVYAMVGMLLSEDEPDDEKDEETKGGNETMKHNVFDQDERQEENTLSHSEIQAIISDAKRYGSMRESFLAHAAESSKDIEQTYGIKGADDWLFPDARNLNTPPEFIKRDMGWVAKVMGAVRHSPFSRIKSMFADITEDDARAKGYIKGKLKKEEVFSLLKRTTTPTTIYQ